MTVTERAKELNQSLLMRDGSPVAKIEAALRAAAEEARREAFAECAAIAEKKQPAMFMTEENVNPIQAAWTARGQSIAAAIRQRGEATKGGTP